MSLALAAAELTKRPSRGSGLSVFPVPGCAPREAVDRPQQAYRLFMAHSAARHIAVPMGVATMLVAICIERAGMQWLRHNFARFPSTRVHSLPHGYDLIYRLPLPPVPIIGCPQAAHNLLALRGVSVQGEGGWIAWPAPAPYQHVTPGYVVALEAPIAPLPKWIVVRVTARPKVKETPVRRFALRGIDVQRARIAAFVRHSAQGTRADVAFAGGYAAGRLVAQGALGEAAAVELVAEAAVEAGLSRQEARRVTRRGVRAGLAEVSSGAWTYTKTL